MDRTIGSVFNFLNTSRSVVTVAASWDLMLLTYALDNAGALTDFIVSDGGYNPPPTHLRIQNYSTSSATVMCDTICGDTTSGWLFYTDVLDELQGVRRVRGLTLVCLPAHQSCML